MRLFDPRNRDIPPRLASRYAALEVLHTAVDFAAAFLFVIGSVLFFSEATKTLGTWGFLIGSILFAVKPAIRLAREIWLGKHRHIDRLAGQAPEGPDSFQELSEPDNDQPRNN